MRPNVAAAVSTAVLLLALTGCTSTPIEPTASATLAAETSTETPAPLVAETPDAEDPATPEDAFLTAVRAALRDDTQIPNATDEQLLAAAAEACEQLATGAGSLDVRVIEGEQPNQLGYYVDSSAIAGVARMTLCP